MIITSTCEWSSLARSNLAAATIKDDEKMKGYVYILTNESIPGMVKIGYTEVCPEGRAKDISRGTGVPTPFKVEYSVVCANPYIVEQAVHSKLWDHRVNNKREFFSVSVERARTIINFIAFPLCKADSHVSMFKEELKRIAHEIERQETCDALNAIYKKNAERKIAEDKIKRLELEGIMIKAYSIKVFEYEELLGIDKSIPYKINFSFKTVSIKKFSKEFNKLDMQIQAIREQKSAVNTAKAIGAIVITLLAFAIYSVI